MKITLAAVIDIDTSGIHALEDLYNGLQKREIQVYALKLKFYDSIRIS